MNTMRQYGGHKTATMTRIVVQVNSIRRAKKNGGK